MEKKSHIDDHNQTPSDKTTRNKIDKHLRDEKDTISEEDLKNINTDITPEVPTTKQQTTPPAADKSKSDDAISVDAQHPGHTSILTDSPHSFSHLRALN